MKSISMGPAFKYFYSMLFCISAKPSRHIFFKKHRITYTHLFYMDTVN